MSVFQKESRLLSPVDFKKVFASKTLERYRFFTIFYRKNLLNYPRIGLAVSKKNVAKSVGRNKIKRIIRESFRNSGLIACDYVVVVSHKIKYYSKQELRENLDKAWLNFKGS